jgi:hypothetical protein
MTEIWSTRFSSKLIEIKEKKVLKANTVRASRRVGKKRKKNGNYGRHRCGG